MTAKSAPLLSSWWRHGGVMVASSRKMAAAWTKAKRSASRWHWETSPHVNTRNTGGTNKKPGSSVPQGAEDALVLVNDLESNEDSPTDEDGLRGLEGTSAEDWPAATFNYGEFDKRIDATREASAISPWPLQPKSQQRTFLHGRRSGESYGIKERPVREPVQVRRTRRWSLLLEGGEGWVSRLFQAGHGCIEPSRMFG